jgi:acetyl esterase
MLEPAMIDFIRETTGFYPTDAAERSVAEQRRLYDAYAAAFTPPRPAGVAVTDEVLALADRSIPLRLYRGGGPVAGTLVYFHGGGFVLGSLDSHEMITARLAADTQAAVVAVDYRLAPEHPAPAAFLDCLAVAEAATRRDLPFAGLPTRLLLAGDSAGGALAAGVALALRDQGGAPPAGMVLIYPGLARDPTPPARDTEAEAPLLTLAAVRAYRDLCLGGRRPGPYHYPLEAERFDGLPPALLTPVEHDPLRDDAVLFAARLREAGGAADVWMGTGLVHGCLRAIGRSPATDAMIGVITDFVGRRLAG